MSISRAAAKPLCTAAEFELVNESYPPIVKALDVKALRQRVTRARKLRDKYSDLAAKQTREIKGKSAPTRRRAPTGNQATVTKQAFFAETLERYEARLGIAERKVQREAAKSGAEKAKAALSRALERKKASEAGPGPSRKAGRGMKSVPTDKSQAYPNLPMMRGATRAAHARAQAKRDNRGK